MCPPHGSAYKVYGDALLKMMKGQLQLDTARQVVDLAKCPMSQEAYEKILKEKGVIPMAPAAETSNGGQ